MESIKKLQEAAKECLSDLRGMESKLSIAEGNIADYKKKADDLKREVEKLISKKSELVDFIQNSEDISKKQQEAKIKELSIKEDVLAGEIAKAKSKQMYLDNAIQSAEEMKKHYEVLSTDYEKKIADLNEKRERLQAVLK